MRIIQRKSTKHNAAIGCNYLQTVTPFSSPHSNRTSQSNGLYKVNKYIHVGKKNRNQLNGWPKAEQRDDLGNDIKKMGIADWTGIA
jgi:hypothetical protein